MPVVLTTLLDKILNRDKGQSFNALNLGLLLLGIILLISALRNVTITDTITALLSGKLPDDNSGNGGGLTSRIENSSAIKDAVEADKDRKAAEQDSANVQGNRL